LDPPCAFERFVVLLLSVKIKSLSEQVKIIGCREQAEARDADDYCRGAQVFRMYCSVLSELLTTTKAHDGDQ
jgi:hypothetical protein